MKGVICYILNVGKHMAIFSITINLPSWISVSCFACVILLFVIFNSFRDKEYSTFDGRLFLTITCVTFVNVIVNCLASIPWDGSPTTEIWLRVANFLNYTMTTSLFLIYSFYVYSRLGDNRSHALVFIYVLFAIFLVDFSLCFASIWTSYYFNFGDNGYERGSLFYVHVIFLCLMALLVEIIIVSYWKRLDRKSLKYLASFPILPFVGMVLQIVFYGIPMALVFVTFAILMVSYYQKTRSTETDYLTGTSNRRKLDSALYERIKEAKGNRSFSVILLDLDNFKSINDNLGHTIGDLALEDAAKILKKSLKTKEDFVGRYGGDEFCLVSDVTDPAGLAEIARKIDESVDDFNKTAKRPYKLGFSMGYAIYDPSNKIPLHDFYDIVDKRMYSDKASKNLHSGR